MSMSSAPTAATYVFGEETLHPFTVGGAVSALICENSPLFFQNFARACGWELVSLKSPKPSAINKMMRQSDALIGWATRDVGMIFDQLYAEAEIPYRPVLIAVGYEANVDVGNLDFFAFAESRQIRQTLTSAINMRSGFLKVVHRSADQQSQLDAYRERESEQARTAQELRLFKDVIGSKVAHELKTPMLQVKGAVNELVHADESSASRSTLIKYALQATNRLEGIIQDITMHAEGLEVNLQPMIAGEAVEHALRSYNRRSNAALFEGRLSVDLDDSRHIVWGDWRGLNIVLQNLIDNALKFSPAASSVHLSVYREDDWVWYSIQDHGIGISEAELKNIFDAFYQVESEDNRRFEGSGLGLSLVKMILDKHNAELIVESTVDVGSTFSFCLPVVQF